MSEKSRGLSDAGPADISEMPGRSDSNSTGVGEQPVENLLSEMTQSSADLARAALGWILPDGESLTELSQVDLQEFLWYQLPTKWLVETLELHEIVWSLADLFSAAGLERYAVLCRAPETHQILDAWQDSDREPARKMMIKAVTASGVDPPETPLLEWGSVMGVSEHSCSRLVSQALEQAIAAGELVPGARGCKQRAVQITEASLMMPRLDLRGDTMLSAVCRERGERWAAGHPQARQDLLTSILPLLEGEVAIPAGAADSLTPLRWLLEQIGDGATLTQAGWLPKALVVKANVRFGWFDMFGFQVRTETDLPELALLNATARRTRLITKRGRKVSLSATGRKALGDPSMLWRIVIADIFSANTFEGEGAALAAATLVNANLPLRRKGVEAKVRVGLEGRWNTSSGEPLGLLSGLQATRDFGRLADAFGWFEKDDDWQNRTWTLTSTGRAALLLGLQLQARSPRHRI